MGPMSLSPDRSVDVAPHPHMGLQTVTWLFSGEFLHRDSLGSEQLIRAGQLNLMTSGHGVAHSEENPGLRSGELHGMQLWVAQPTSTRDGGAGFEHFAEMPTLETPTLTASVLVGAFAGSRHRRAVTVITSASNSTFTAAPPPCRSSRRTSTRSSWPTARCWSTAPSFDRGRWPTSAPVVTRCRFESHGPSRAMLIGGVPFDERLFMWWNFVARTQDEISDAWRAWATGDERFGRVASPFARIEVSPPPWLMAMH